MIATWGERLRRQSEFVDTVCRAWERDAELSLAMRFAKGRAFAMALARGRWHLRRCDVVGKRPRARGRPWVQNFGRITVGDDFNVVSHIVPTHLMCGPGAHLQIGHGVSLNFGVGIACFHGVVLGDGVRMGPYVMVLDTSFHGLTNRAWQVRGGGPVVIEDDVLLGLRCTVMPGARIGRGSIITPASVVHGHIPANTVATGNPARVVRVIDPGPEPAQEAGEPDPALVREVQQTVADVFGGPHPGLRDGPKQISGWDTLGQASLIAALEARFGIRMGVTDVAHMNDVASVCRRISRQRASRKMECRG